MTMRRPRPGRRLSITVAALVGAAIGIPAAVTRPSDAEATETTTPIKHVIVIIGENHTFDNVFATYQPRSGSTVRNLLSEGIVTAQGKPGPNYHLAVQLTARDTTGDPGRYSLTPSLGPAYATLPQPQTTAVPPACSGLIPNVADTIPGRPS